MWNKPTVQYKRENLIVDEIYWLHPQDRPAGGYRSRPARIMHGNAQVNLWETSVNVQVPLAQIEELARQDAEFFLKLRNPNPGRDALWWFKKHMASLKGTIVGDQVVTEYTLTPLYSGRVCTPDGKRSWNVFQDLFLVWHIKRNVGNSLVFQLSLKDKKGWEVAFDTRP